MDAAHLHDESFTVKELKTKGDRPSGL